MSQNHCKTNGGRTFRHRDSTVSGFRTLMPRICKTVVENAPGPPGFSPSAFDPPPNAQVNHRPCGRAGNSLKLKNIKNMTAHRPPGKQGRFRAEAAVSPGRESICLFSSCIFLNSNCGFFYNQNVKT